jgi:hypothetical protein
MHTQGQKVLEAISDLQCDYFYESNAENFTKIPGVPIAYWVSNRIFSTFNEKSVSDFADSRKGLVTLDNNRFLRIWNEVCWKTVGIGLTRQEAINGDFKWIPIHKGGEYRRWYGNNDYVVNWEKDGREIKENIVKKYKGGSYTKEVRSEDKYFEEGITWTVVSSSKTSFRRYDKGFIFSNSGESITSKNNKEILDYLIGLLNTKFSEEILKIIAPTLGFESGYIGQIPVIVNDQYKQKVIELSGENVKISKNDWDACETSWDFKKHPLI